MQAEVMSNAAHSSRGPTRNNQEFIPLLELQVRKALKNKKLINEVTKPPSEKGKLRDLLNPCKKRNECQPKLRKEKTLDKDFLSIKIRGLKKLLKKYCPESELLIRGAPCFVNYQRSNIAALTERREESKLTGTLKDTEIQFLNDSLLKSCTESDALFLPNILPENWSMFSKENLLSDYGLLYSSMLLQNQLQWALSDTITEENGFFNYFIKLPFHHGSIYGMGDKNLQNSRGYRSENIDYERAKNVQTTDEKIKTVYIGDMEIRANVLPAVIPLSPSLNVLTVCIPDLNWNDLELNLKNILESLEDPSNVEYIIIQCTVDLVNRVVKDKERRKIEQFKRGNRQNYVLM